MEINHTLTINAPADRVWALMTRPDAVVESLPGVTLTSLEGDHFSGGMSVGLGPMRLKYSGTGSLRYDVEAHSVHIEAKGSEARGAGNASAVVDVAVVTGAADSTRLDIRIDLNLQGKPAQFGRGILAEVVGRLATQFGKNLEKQIIGSAAATASTETREVFAGISEVEASATSRVARRADAWSSSALVMHLVGAGMGAIVGGMVAAALKRRTGSTVQITIVASEDPGWIDLVRELSRQQR